MAFITRFQRLFAIKLMHSFYLDGLGGTAFYGLTADEQKKILLSYDIRPLLSIRPTELTEKILKKHSIKWALEEQGFFTGIEMHPLSINTALVPLPLDARLAFAISFKNGIFSNITNMTLANRDALPFKFYWTNDNLANARYPSVSQPLKGFVADQTYEMGECIRHTNKNWEAIKQHKTAAFTAAFWREIPVANFHNYVNGSDRVGLAKRFSMRFDKWEIRNLRIELKNAAGQSLKIISHLSQTPFSSLNFDFSFYEAEITEGGQTRKIRVPTQDGAYQLSISGDQTLNFPTVFLYDALANSETLGIVEIVSKAGLNSFSIQNADKTLINPHPEFEVRFQNRLTYRRFLDNTAQTIKNHAAGFGTEYVYENTKKYLDRTVPDRLSRAPTQLKIVAADELKLPEPSSFQLKLDDSKTQYLTEIQF